MKVVDENFVVDEEPINRTKGFPRHILDGSPRFM